MCKVVILIAIILHLSVASIIASSCYPNTQLILGDIFCVCAQNKQWSRNECETIERNYNFNLSDDISSATNREQCLAQLRLITTCAKCICLTNGTLKCNFTKCLNNNLRKKSDPNVGLIGPWCKPFSSYYINCKICVCPSSGNFSEANCIVDDKCKIKSAPIFNDRKLMRNTSCVPNIMYVFECLSCVCSQNGNFSKDRCIETCPNLYAAKKTERCTPYSHFRKDCNICYCPESGEVLLSLCTNKNCSKLRNGTVSSILRSTDCVPYHFTQPTCYYYGCTNGTVDTKWQIEADCIKGQNIKYDVTETNNTNKCKPGEVIPSCKECFCLKNQSVSLEFCTEGCTYKAKLYILDKILNESKGMTELIDKNAILNLGEYENCTKNSIYIDSGKYCICPENGLTNFKICLTSHTVSNFVWRIPSHKNISIDFNATCTPSTYVEFDCNSCFCSRNGTIDPKWCTYDDCHAIKLIKDSQNLVQVSLSIGENVTCTPGTISQSDCNFCICSKSGLVSESVCTETECLSSERQVKQDQFLCDPVEYYPVDCNICLCPHDGIKNLDKCTKKTCTKSYLRSDSCTPGELFADECNLCICPASGDKNEKACFKNQCSETSSPWKKIFELTSNLIGKQIPSVSKKLEYCFPGEEFVVGCQLCVCPDLGIKSYAKCTDTYCEGNVSITISQNIKVGSDDETRRYMPYNIRQKTPDQLNLDKDATFPPKRCNPGSMYIIRCRQCICPYMGDVSWFCKDLPDDFVCEQAFPDVNYVPFIRRSNGENETGDGTNVTGLNVLQNKESNKKKTKYRCDESFKYQDECFICVCENNETAREDCYRADKSECNGVVPTFLSDDNKIN